jgi:hypothetical protein
MIADGWSPDAPAFDWPIYGFDVGDALDTLDTREDVDERVWYFYTAQMKSVFLLLSEGDQIYVHTDRAGVVSILLTEREIDGYWEGQEMSTGDRVEIWRVHSPNKTEVERPWLRDGDGESRGRIEWLGVSELSGE